jgi:HTH-type transcriptional regulator, cell division transcriptional repressor
MKVIKMFGKRLKTAREAKGLTMDELIGAYKIRYPDSGLNKGTLSKYENEKQEPMVSTVKNLSEILGVSTDYLTGKIDKFVLDDLNNMEMGDKIYTLRKQLGLTLEDVGNIVGVGKSTVRRWENGDIANMRRDKIAKLANALQTTPAYLMGWTNEEEPANNGELNNEVDNIFTNLTAEKQKQALDFLRFLQGESDNS